MTTSQRLVAFFVAASIVVVAAWVSARQVLQSRMTIGAARDLETIVDLAAVTLSGASRSGSVAPGQLPPGGASAELIDLRRTLERASDRQLRTVYFFDNAGRVLRLGDAAVPAGEPVPADATATTPAIVRDALVQRVGSDTADPVARGIRFEPYTGLAGDDAVGAWRYLPELAIGIVAERPYDLFIRALRWLDGAFLTVLVALLLGSLYMADAAVARLRAVLRRPAVESCGPYVLDRRIGEGAMSDVFLAHHRLLGRRVAVKRLKMHAHRDELSARFTREAKLASHLSHPNIVALHDYGALPEGGFWYAMEFIDGLTLTDWVGEQGPVAADRVVRMLRQLTAAVGHMHRHGLLHRDIKPDNIMAYAADGDYDAVKLIDFGLIKDLQTGASRDLTRDVRVLGTPAFMAPERLADPRTVDERSDLYGIGCVAFYLLTARKPFESTSAADLAQQVLHVDAPLASSVAPVPVPPALDALVASCLAKNMSHRFADADALIAALDRIAAEIPWQRDEAVRWWETRSRERT
jgi:tRNA A-37 threonylcarbamoyl transferase component Bud32